MRILNNVFPRVGIESTTIACTDTRFCHCEDQDEESYNPFGTISSDDGDDGEDGDDC